MLTSQHEGTETSSLDDDSEDLSEVVYSEDLSEDDYHCMCHGAAQVTHNMINAPGARVNRRNAARRLLIPEEKDEWMQFYIQAVHDNLVAAQVSFLLH